MDYEKMYKNALKRAKQIHEYSSDLAEIKRMEELFPELKESNSNDEQCRKWILEYLYDGLRKSDEQFKGQFKCAIVWLEKQGRHKVWTDNDYNRVKSIEYLLHELDNHNFDDWFNSLKKDNA